MLFVSIPVRVASRKSSTMGETCPELALLKPGGMIQMPSCNLPWGCGVSRRGERWHASVAQDALTCFRVTSNLASRDLECLGIGVLAPWLPADNASS